MNVTKIVVLSGTITFATLSTYTQGTFQNLDFEQANPVFIPRSPFNDATAASALPFWTATIGGVVQSGIPVNDPSTGSPWVSLVATGDVYGTPIDGNYSVLLQGGGSAEAAISQTGIIPTGTQSLLFKANPPIVPAPNGPLDFFVGTQMVPLVEVGTGLNYVVYGANLSAWSGQTEQITFSDPAFSGNWEIDDISFSPTAVTPEPSPLILAGIGGLVFALYRRFFPKHP